MKYLLFAMSIFALSACGGGGGSSGGNGNDDGANGNNEPPVESGDFALQNIRFDAKDFYDNEVVTITEGTSFELQWVSPTSASYRIDLYLTSNGEVYSDSNKIVALRCGGASFSLCPNATGAAQCEFNNNDLSCSIGADVLGNKSYLDENESNLRLIIRGCDSLDNCDVKTFNLLLQSNEGG
ncbi:MAG: hypothetical protein V7736_05480 [Colwellia polaris]|jgi:hypothetical protein|uniref:hypothetical protein n=1 Tax=Colwellia polaris TaxID=326537 RepID=UPI00117803F9|nr:hypothetical protein [Colwellia polaris]|tara:strand:+ start:5071 stop:5616 length:546 start_codon:yes stop_codon:yes gene_type:complete